MVIVHDTSGLLGDPDPTRAEVRESISQAARRAIAKGNRRRWLGACVVVVVVSGIAFRRHFKRTHAID
jgi:methylphosphotriester-DNA--protein-cysteine methyltransferase